VTVTDTPGPQHSRSAPVPLLGVDWAVDPRNVGLARGALYEGSVLVEEVSGGKGISPADLLSDWLLSAPRGVLAIDAPLGWPAPMADALRDHAAGLPWRKYESDPFGRATDRFVARMTGKKPLDVGAQLIAKTAHSALALLEELRRLTRLELPLLWNEAPFDGWGVIEVYPAATLANRRLLRKSYSREEESRRTCLAGLSSELSFRVSEDEVCRSPHRLDAVVAMLTAADFVRGGCPAPENLDIAKREGWIWFPAASHF
jgi:predicted nuclease with RNAse H fold